MRKTTFFRIVVILCLAAGAATSLWNPLAAQDGNLLQLAGRYMQSGQGEKALTLYEQLYKSEPTAFIYEGYLHCLQELGRYDEAERLVRKQMKRSHIPVLLKVDLAENHILSGNPKKAETVLSEIVEKTDFSQAGLSVEELAENVVKKTKNYSAAIEIYQKARSLQTVNNQDDLIFVGTAGSQGTTPGYGTPAGQGSPYGQGNAAEKGAGAQPYAFRLADLYRLTGRYEPMLNEYLDVLAHEEERHDEVYTRLQALMSERGKNTPPLLTLIARKVQQEPQDAVAQNLYIWALLQEKNYEAALERSRIYSNRFNDKGDKWLQTLRTLRDKAPYEEVCQKYEEFIAQTEAHPAHYNQGFIRTAKTDLLDICLKRLESRKIKDSAQVERIKNDYKKLFDEIGKGPESYPLYRHLTKIYAYYCGQKDSAQLLLQQALQQSAFNTMQKAWLKIDMADMLLFYDKVWDATLLYSQVEKDFKQDPIGFYAKLQNAKLSYYIGEFEWAESQLKVLRAATSKLIANDAMELSLLIKEGMNPDSTYDGLKLLARADFLVVRTLYGEALEKLNTILSMPLEGGLYDEVYLRKAKIYLQLDSIDACLQELERIYRDFAETDDLLVDDALFMAAGLLQLRAGFAIDPETEFLQGDGFPPVGSPVYGVRTEAERASDREAALLLYQRLFTDYRSSALAPLARQRYRQLRL